MLGYNLYAKALLINELNILLINELNILLINELNILLINELNILLINESNLLLINELTINVEAPVPFEFRQKRTRNNEDINLEDFDYLNRCALRRRRYSRTRTYRIKSTNHGLWPSDYD
jgi:hypothetical protein